MTGINRGMTIRQVFATICFLAGLAAVGSASAAEVILELRAGRDFQGGIRSATYDERGVAWTATKYQLFRAENDRVRLVDSAGDNRRLALAPGGARYAWLNSSGAVFGQFDVELLALDGPPRSLGHPYDDELPRGFGTLYFSVQGRLLLAVRALQDLDGLRGEFAYVIFSGDGVRQGAVTRTGLRNAVLDESGDAVLLIGESETESIMSNGKPLWRLPEAYGQAAVGAKGSVALLSSLKRSTDVHVIRGDVVTQLEMPAPVRNLAITPDGTRAVVATEGGRTSLIEIDRCSARICPMRQLPPLPILSAHEITDIRFLDKDTVALGVILAYGMRPTARYYRGVVVVMTATGSLEFQRSIDMPLPVTVGPRLDVVYGRRAFTAYSPSSAMVVRTGP